MNKIVGLFFGFLFSGSMSAQQYQFDQAKFDAFLTRNKENQDHSEAFRKNATLQNFSKMSLEDQRIYLKSFIMAPDINFYFIGSDEKPLSIEKQNEIFAARLKSMSAEQQADVYLEILKTQLDMDPKEVPYRPLVLDGVKVETYGKLNELLIKKADVNTPARQQKFLCEAMTTNFGKAIDGRESNFSPEFVKPEQNRIAAMEKYLKMFKGHNDQCIVDDYGSVQYFSMSQALLFVKTELTQYVNLQRSQPKAGPAKTQPSVIPKAPACTRKEIENYITTYADYVNQNKSTHNFGFLVFDGLCRITAKLHLINKKWHLQDFIMPSNSYANNLVPFTDKQELINLLMAKQMDPQKPGAFVAPIPAGIAPARQPVVDPSKIPTNR